MRFACSGRGIAASPLQSGVGLAWRNCGSSTFVVLFLRTYLGGLEASIGGSLSAALDRSGTRATTVKVPRMGRGKDLEEQYGISM
jgi:hypothetical protein